MTAKTPSDSAASDNKHLTDNAPLASLNRETGNRVIEEMIMAADGAKAGSSETDMESRAGFPEDRILDEAAESTIILDANLTIQHVVQLYEKLKESYDANNSIEINAAQVSSIDTSTLQLLVALKKNAVKQQKEVIFVAPSRRFIESAGLLGLLDILDLDTEI
jgi:anti-anti-sigma regulatory factor